MHGMQASVGWMWAQNGMIRHSPWQALKNEVLFFFGFYNLFLLHFEHLSLQIGPLIVPYNDQGVLTSREGLEGGNSLLRSLGCCVFVEPPFDTL